ncbi:aspartate 1-decarboxylase [uncultured Eubacterium sp.]|uniref:aspartate 1-decarboxylase n=1 Tax=uncultured Eubacterium sp. TaxID=165185 RepID=UPI00267128BB|nr:aspartate 1-decarboxylase [uncultured Eubacterium sp.]
MQINMLKSKIHRATVVQSELDYVGSITIDEALMEAAGIYEYEKVQIADVNNGNRFETYVIAGEKNSGMICLNGAAAHMVSLGDKIIIMSYAQMTPEEIKENRPKVVFVDDENKITRLTNYEKHGKLFDLMRDETK